MVARNSAIGIILFVVFASLSFGETTYYNADSIIVSESEWNEIAKRWNEHIRQRSTLISKPVNQPQNKGTTQSYNNAPEENSNISLPPPQATYNPASLPPTQTTYNPISVTPSVPVNYVSAPVSQQPSVVKKLSKPVNLLPASKGIDWGKVTGKAIAHTIAVAIICGIIALVAALRKKKLPLGTIWKQKNSNSTLGKEHENMPEMEGKPINIQETNKKLVGVRGWLLLLVVGMMVLYPLGGVISIASEFLTTERQNPSLASSDVWRTFTTAIMWVFAGFSAISFYGGWGLTQVNSQSAVMRAKVILWITGPVASLVLWVMVPFLVFDNYAVDAQFIRSFVSSLVSASIWTLYLSKSKRVHNTYGNNSETKHG